MPWVGPRAQWERAESGKSGNQAKIRIKIRIKIVFFVEWEVLLMKCEDVSRLIRF